MGIKSLEHDVTEVQQICEIATEFAVEFLSGLDTAPTSGTAPSSTLLESLLQPPCEEGRPFRELVDQFRAATESSLETASPRCMAFVPSGGLFVAAIADFLSAVTNRFVPASFAAPALAQLEAGVIRWCLSTMGLPPTGWGTLTSGATMATTTALASARLRIKSASRGVLTVLTSAAAHISVDRAARIAGIDHVYRLATTRDLTLVPETLETAIQDSRSRGETPMAIVSTAGTTDIGTVDPLRGIAEVARAHGLWLHVDAAYGGFFVLTNAGQKLLDGISEADSIAIDPHKGLFLPFGTGCLLVRDGNELRKSCGGTTAPYASIRNEEIPSPMDYSPEISREFRALRLWFCLHLHGERAFREALEEKLALARRFFDGLQSIPELEAPFEPVLSVVVFRVRGKDDGPTHELYQWIMQRGRILVSSTTVHSTYFIRVCVLSHRTHEMHIEELLTLLRDAVRARVACSRQERVERMSC